MSLFVQDVFRLDPQELASTAAGQLKPSCREKWKPKRCLTLRDPRKQQSAKPEGTPRTLPPFPFCSSSIGEPEQHFNKSCYRWYLRMVRRVPAREVASEIAPASDASHSYVRRWDLSGYEFFRFAAPALPVAE